MGLNRKSLDVISESRDVIGELRRLTARLEVYVEDLENAASPEGDDVGDEPESNHRPE